MQASGVFAGSNRAKIDPSGTRVSKFLTYSKCGHIALRLGAFQAKAINTKSPASIAAISNKSFSSSAILQHSYVASWHATEPASQRLPHRFTAHHFIGAQAPGLDPGHQQNERPRSNANLRPQQRWLAGQWSLFSQSRLFACKSEGHGQCGRQQRRNLHRHHSMEAACAALQMMQIHQKGEWRLLTCFDGS